MKRMTMTATLWMLLALTGNIFAQGNNVDWIEKWHLSHPEIFDESAPNAWLFGDRMYTGLAYDTTRDVVYVVSPDEPRCRIFAFDAENGAPALRIGGGEVGLPGQLYVDPLVVQGGHEKFSLYKIAVDEDGRIYACNAVVPAQDSGAAFKVYRWNDDGSAPELIYEYTPPQTTEVLGTAFEVTGKRHLIGGQRHDSARIYVSTSALDSNGTGDDELHILAADTRQNAPHDFRLVQRIVNPDTMVRYFGAGIAPVTDSRVSQIHVCSEGGPIRRMQQFDDNQTLPYVDTAIIVNAPSAYTGIGAPLSIFIESDYSRYLFVGNVTPSTPQTNELNLNNVAQAFLDVTGLSTGSYPPGPTPNLGYNHPSTLIGNVNHIGDVDHKIWTDRGNATIKYQQVFYLISNGGIACFIARSPLWVPVELSSFTAHLEGSTVMLDWSTASETSNYGFEVERTFGGTWERAGFVEGHGTTTAAQEYAWSEPVTPTHTRAGTVRYRLRQVDFDGTFEYSPEVEVTIGAPPGIALHQNYPNPFRGNTTVSYSVPAAQPVTLTVYNTLGQPVRLVEQEAVQGRNTLQLTSLRAGMYMVVLNTGTGTVTRRIVGR